MRSQDRDHRGRGRAGCVTGTYRGLRLNARPVRPGICPFETLESRLLLSTSPVSHGNVPPVVMTPIAALVSLQAAPAVKLVTHPAAMLDLPPGWNPSTVRGGMSGSIVAANGAGRLVTASAAVMSISSTTTGDLGELTVPPVIVLAYPVDVHASAPGQMAPGSWSAGQGTGSPVAGGSGSRVSSPTTGGIPTANSTGTTASLPVYKHVQVDGMLDGPQSSVTLQIPVGPMTRSVGLSVHGNSMSGPLPLVDQMALIDRDGATLARFGPLWDPRNHEPDEDVTVSLNDAPMGGTLIVQLSAPPNGAAAFGSTSLASSGSFGWSIPFVMDVQRLDSAWGDATGGMGPSLRGPSGGEMMVGVLPQAGSPRNGGSTGSRAAARGDRAGGESGGPAPAAASEPTAPPSSSDEAPDGPMGDGGFSGRIATGPLAARSAAPLGPNLATVLLDEAPAVDRHERALSQELAAGGEGHDTPGRRALRDHAEAASSRRGTARRPGDSPPPDGTQGVIAGLGALPMKVSGSAGGDRTVDLDALLAALSGLAGPGDRPQIAEGEGLAADQLLAALAVPHPSENERRPAPDYLTSACVLALGMGLVTRPIIPDLLRLVPARSSRWRIVPPGAGLPPHDGGSRDRGFGRRRRRCPG